MKIIHQLRDTLTHSALGLAALLLSAVPVRANTTVGDWSFLSSANPGWSLWRTATPTATGVQLGTVGGQEGGIYMSESGLTATNCGVEMIYTASNVGDDYRTYLRMYNGTEAVGLGTVGGNVFLSGWDSNFNPPSWEVSAAALVDGAKHSLALVLLDDGTVNAYLDGTLLASRTGLSPTAALTTIGVGNEISGGWYIPRGTVVERVRTFAFDSGTFDTADLLEVAAAGAVDPGTATVSASPTTVDNDGSSTATITVILRDSVGTGVPGKVVALAKTAGPGSPVITAVSDTTSGTGVATFTVACDTVGDYVFTATDITDDPNVAVTASATVTFANLPWKHHAWTGDEDSGIINGATYTAAVNFGDDTAVGAGGGPVTVNGIPFLASATSGTGYTLGGATEVNGGGAGEFVTGTSATLAAGFIYGGNPRTITLSGLTPGATYETSLFAFGWENSGRLIEFTSGTDSRTIDQDLYGQGKGIRITYTFVADSGTKELTAAQGPGGSFHLSAMANRLVSGGTPANYAGWLSANPIAGSQAANLDHDNDGVSNGIEYFMFGAVDTTRVDANPGIVAGTVTWPHAGAVTSWEVQVSNDLDHWDPAAAGEVDTTSSPGNVIYTLPTVDPRKFCRLMVIP